MTHAAVIAAAAAVTFGTRLTGFLVGDRPIPATVDRFLQYVPVAVFAALVTPDLSVGGGELVARIAGIIAASIVVLRVGQLWAGLASGMAVYWIVRALFGS